MDLLKTHKDYQSKIINLLIQIKNRWVEGVEAAQLQNEAEALYKEYDKLFEDKEREYCIVCEFQKFLCEKHLSRYLYIDVGGA